MARYKYASVHEWFGEWLDRMVAMGRFDPDDLRMIAKDLAHKLDADTLQDEYQNEMANDDYFQDQECVCDGCGEISDEPYPVVHGDPLCEVCQAAENEPEET